MATFIVNTKVQSDNDSEDNKLCENTDCERFPPDWDDKDTEETYQEDQWKKCSLCIGYFNDDGLGDILFIEEEPNNRNASCDLCGKDKNIVQMKGTGQYICERACDENEEDSEEDELEKTQYLDHMISSDKSKKEVDIKPFEESNKCDDCNIKLDSIRDGSIDKNIRCNNCYWEDKEGKDSNNIIKPDYRENKEESRYVVCDNCNKNIDCWNTNIYCLYKGDQNCPTEEITICATCNEDLSKEFKEDGYNCDDWDENEEDDCIFNYYICKHCFNTTINDDPNCSKCNKEMCMELFQDVNQSAALLQAKKKYEINEEEVVYQLQNTYKKSIYQCEQWNNVLENGKKVRYEITTFFRWGTFEVEITKKEVNELLLKDEIILNDIPGCSIQELWDGCDRYEEIVNKEKYTEEELKEIHRLLFFNDEEPDCYISDCEDNIDEDLLEYNEWSMDDTIYGISGGGCTLEITSD